MKPFNIEKFKVGDYVIIDEPYEHTRIGMHTFFKVDDIRDNGLRAINPDTFKWFSVDGGDNDMIHKDATLRKSNPFETLVGLMDCIIRKDNVLSFFDETIKHTNSDEALRDLLSDYYKEINHCDLDGGFHKCFRQADVTGVPSVDMTIHTLLYDAPLFWHLFEKLRVDN
jgi:hypothetical protein